MVVRLSLENSSNQKLEQNLSMVTRAIMLARVRVSGLRALGTLTLLVWAKGIVEPAGCKGLWG